MIIAAIMVTIVWFIAAKEALDLKWVQTIVTVILGWLGLVVIMVIAGVVLGLLGLGVAAMGGRSLASRRLTLGVVGITLQPV